MTKRITSFTARYRFLSNMYPASVTWNAIYFPAVENAYQAAKSFDPNDWEKFCLMTPIEARKAGRKLNIRHDWEMFKLPLMEVLLRRKFVGPMLDALLATAPLDIIEGNWWGDRFWGQCPVGEGRNELGKLLVKIRSEILPLTKD